MRQITNALLMLAVSVLCQAQTTPTNVAVTSTGKSTVTLEGTVTDPSGAVIVGAVVTVRGAVDFPSVTTGADGKFRIHGLTPGPLEITVSAAGFATFKSEGFQLGTDETNYFDVPLQLAGAQAQVKVEGERIAQVETETAEVSGTITQRQMVSLGLNGRNFSTLIALAPGVS